MAKPQKSTDLNEEILLNAITQDAINLKSAITGFTASMIQDFCHDIDARFIALTDWLEDSDHKSAAFHTLIGDLQDDFQAIMEFDSTFQ